MDVPLMHEKCTGYVSSMTGDQWDGCVVQQKRFATKHHKKRTNLLSAVGGNKRNQTLQYS